MRTHGNWFLVPARCDAPGHRLICFSHAGGGASSYHAWGHPLSQASIEVMAVQLPGHETRVREAPLTSLTDLVAAVARALVVVTDRPYALFGHSLGALVAFETACALRELGAPPPEHLFVSSAPAPSAPRERAMLHELGDEAFIEAVTRQYGGMPAEVLAHLELLALVMPALRADMTMIETYVSTTTDPLACPIVAYGGAQDQVVGVNTLLGWQRHTRAGFEYECFDGDHFYLQTRRDELLGAIMSRLRRHTGRRSWPGSRD